jgi:hypothetical protein
MPFGRGLEAVVGDDLCGHSVPGGVTMASIKNGRRRGGRCAERGLPARRGSALTRDEFSAAGEAMAASGTVDADPVSFSRRCT